MREMDQTLVLTAWRSRAGKWHYTLPAKYFVLEGLWSPGAFLLILILFPSLTNSHLQIVYLMADVPCRQFLGACHTAKKWLLITDVCVETKQDRLCIGP